MKPRGGLAGKRFLGALGVDVTNVTRVESSVDVKPASYRDPDLHRRRAELLEYGERPFGRDTWGLARDGKNLWVLDNKRKCICMIEKTASGKEITAALDADTLDHHLTALRAA